jgi:endonuclease III-like uncharacterized protein
MNTAKEILFNLIEEIPENEMAEVIDFIGYLKTKREKELFKDLQKVSESSISFWDNDKDDEEWNNV